MSLFVYRRDSDAAPKALLCVGQLLNGCESSSRAYTKAEELEQ